MQVFFARYGKQLPVTANPDDYKTGDLVTWMLKGNRPHIGIVTYLRSKTSNNPLMVHNVGDGPKLQDILFIYKITGHYRYNPFNR